MKKGYIIGKVSNEIGLDKKVCKIVIDSYLRLIKESLLSGEAININQVGVIQRVYKKERNLYSPKKNEEISLKEHYSLKFKMSKSIKQQLDMMEVK